MDILLQNYLGIIKEASCDVATLYHSRKKIKQDLFNFNVKKLEELSKLLDNLKEEDGFSIISSLIASVKVQKVNGKTIIYKKQK